MFKRKDILIALIFLFIGIGSTFVGSADVVQAATFTPTATATRILHVVAKPRNTPTPTGTVANTPTATATPESAQLVLGGSIEATVQAYIEQSRTLTNSEKITPVAPITVQPVRLVIPSLKVDALIESVGRDKTGAMDTPSKVEDVAWYGLGTAPGEVGNAVIAGHLDLADGSPAVFWNIGKLKQGAEVVVYDAEDTAFHFQVTGTQRYKYDGAPVEDIFGFSLKPQLNLITCAGTWDRNSRNYSNRLVVYTELVEIVYPN